MGKTGLLHRYDSPVHRGQRSLVAMSLRAAAPRAALSGQKVRRVLRACAGLLVAALCTVGQTAHAVDYTIHVKTSSPALLSELLSQTTTGYFLGTATKSTSFANTWNVTITAKNPVQPGQCPPDFVSGQELLTALVALSSSTYPYGWANGMEYERSDNVNTLYQMQGYDYANKTVGGKPVTGGFTIPELMGSTVPVAGFDTKYVSTSTVFMECLGMYNVAVSTIQVKNFAAPPLIPGF